MALSHSTIGAGWLKHRALSAVENKHLGTCMRLLFHLCFGHQFRKNVHMTISNS